MSQQLDSKSPRPRGGTLADDSNASVLARWRRGGVPGPLGAPAFRAVPYLWALAGIGVASAFIALVQRYVHIANISLVYLPVVLWLAAVFGRAPAVFASFLAFLAYDFLFIRPLYQFTVHDPTEWLSLLALLITSLVAGQLTAAVRRRQREAEENAARTDILYKLAQLTVSIADPDQLNQALCQHVVDVFAPFGVQASALYVPDLAERLRVAALAGSGSGYENALALTSRKTFAEALYAIEHRATAGHALSEPGTRPNDVALFVPLQTAQRVVAVLGIAGADSIRRLIERSNPEAGLFATFCGQIAVALDRASLQQEAIHVEALRESDRLKDTLLGSVTHDLRTPLASIKAATGSLLQPDLQLSEAERRELLTSIETSADRLNRLVGNLLDLSRLEAGVALPEKNWYLIGDVIASVLDRLDLTGQTKGYSIVVDTPDDLPLVPMDYGQIEQVLTNLVENAVKYSPTGSEIRIGARVLPSEELEAWVRDQGVGIPQQELEAVFDKFYRVQHVQLPWAPTRPPIGTGLGLAISASIVRAHGGRIWAESTPGSGATFLFTLPLPEIAPRGTLPEAGALATAASTPKDGDGGERETY